MDDLSSKESFGSLRVLTKKYQYERNIQGGIYQLVIKLEGGIIL